MSSRTVHCILPKLKGYPFAQHIVPSYCRFCKSPPLNVRSIRKLESILILYNFAVEKAFSSKQQFPSTSSSMSISCYGRLLNYQNSNTDRLLEMGNQESHANPEKQRQIQEMNRLRKQLEEKEKRLNSLRVEQQTLSKMPVGVKKNMKDYTLDELMQMNHNTFSCPSCQQFYNPEERAPYMICKGQHTICEMCFNKLNSKRGKKNCFSCSEELESYGVNRSVLNLISNKEELLMWVKMRDRDNGNGSQKDFSKESSSANKVHVRLCRFPNHEKIFEMSDDSIIKIGAEASWHTIRSEQPLKPFSTSEVSFKTITSVHNSLILGITTQPQQFQKGFIPSESVAFHLNNGHIYHENVQSGKYEWGSGGHPVAKNSNPEIVMVVNTYQRTVEWRLRGVIQASAKFNNKFDLKPIYVYISMYHKGDMLLLNK